MGTLMLIGPLMVIIPFVFLFACTLATKLTYGFRLSAILGLRREAKRRCRVMYVSNGPFLPTPIFWLGSTEGQENRIAQAMAEGKIHRQDVDVRVSRKAHFNAILNNVQIWPSRELRQQFGSQRDMVA